MKIYISADIEGIAGVVASTQVSLTGGIQYSSARLLMTQEVNAVIDGAFEAGASEVLVNDAHGSNMNLLLEELDNRAELITGKPKLLNMMHGIDTTYDAAIFLGYHAKPGTAEAILDHAYMSSVVYTIRLNGISYGEFGLNAMVAGYYGVPVVMATGDSKFCAEATGLLPNLFTVTVKWAQSRTAARTLSVNLARSHIRETTYQALQAKSKFPELVLHPPKPPLRLEIDFLRTTQADVAALLPNSRRTAGRTVEYDADDYLEIFKACRALLLLAASVVDD